MKRIWIIGLALALVITAVGTPVSGKHYSEWSAAEKITDTSINTTSTDSCPALTKDGLSLYFASNRPVVLVAGTWQPRDLYVSQRNTVDGQWNPPQKLDNINTPEADERCPYITPDGRRLIFVRQSQTGVDDFYMSIRRDKEDDFGWGDPLLIDELSSPGMETAGWGFEDEDSKLTFYFGSTRDNPGTTKFDIFQTTMDSEGNFTTPVQVNELNDPNAIDYGPVVRKDGLELFFTSNRNGSVGGSQDLWVSTRNSTSEPWSTPLNLGPDINTTATEWRAALTWDGMNMVFNSTRDGTYDLFKSQRTKVTGANK